MRGQVKTCYSRMRKQPEGQRHSRSDWNQTVGKPTDFRGRNTETSLSLPFGSLVRANGWIGRTGMASSLLAPDETASWI